MESSRPVLNGQGTTAMAKLCRRQVFLDHARQLGVVDRFRDVKPWRPGVPRTDRFPDPSWSPARSGCGWSSDRFRDRARGLEPFKVGRN